MGTVLGDASITLSLDTTKAREELRKFESEAKRVGESSRVSAESYSSRTSPVEKQPPSPFRVSIKKDGIASVGASSMSAAPVLPKAAQKTISRMIGAQERLPSPSQVGAFARRMAARNGTTVNAMETAANTLRAVTGSGQTVFGKAARLVSGMQTVAPVAKALSGAALVYAGARTLAKSADFGMALAAGIPDISGSPAFGAIRQQVQDAAFAFTKFENHVTSHFKAIAAGKDRAINGARVTGQAPDLMLGAEKRLANDEADMEAAFDRFKRNDSSKVWGKWTYDAIRKGFGY